MPRLITIVLAATLLALSSQSFARQADADSTMTLSGTMVHTTIEGGCWYLDASDGKHYELIGDQGVLSTLRVEGKYVQVRVKPSKGMASVCMVGPIVEVVEDVTPQLHPTDPAIIKMQISGTMHRDGKTWYVRTSKGLRYDFEDPPAKKYRKVGRLYKHIDRVMVMPGRNKVSGLILGAPKVTKPIVPKPTPDPR